MANQAETVRKNLSRILGYEVELTDEPEWVVQQRNRELKTQITQFEFDSIMGSLSIEPSFPADTNDAFEDGWYDAVEKSKSAIKDDVLKASLDSVHSERLMDYYTGAKYDILTHRGGSSY
jgi:hypothetical protein